jgi:hypothetical protein
LQLAAAPVSGAVPQFEFRPPTHADVRSVAAFPDRCNLATDGLARPASAIVALPPSA